MANMSGGCGPRPVSAGCEQGLQDRREPTALLKIEGVRAADGSGWGLGERRADAHDANSSTVTPGGKPHKTGAMGQRRSVLLETAARFAPNSRAAARTQHPGSAAPLWDLNLRKCTYKKVNL